MERLARYAIIILLPLAWATARRQATAQQVTPFELGVGYHAQTNTNFAGTNYAYRHGYTGPFARLTFNVNRSIALEALGFDATNLASSGNKVGGHQCCR